MREREGEGNESKQEGYCSLPARCLAPDTVTLSRYHTLSAAAARPGPCGDCRGRRGRRVTRHSCRRRRRREAGPPSAPQYNSGSRGRRRRCRRSPERPDGRRRRISSSSSSFEVIGISLSPPVARSLARSFGRSVESRERDVFSPNGPWRAVLPFAFPLPALPRRIADAQADGWRDASSG